MSASLLSITRNLVIPTGKVDIDARNDQNADYPFAACRSLAAV
jgi:hypothetical protein